MIMYAVSRVKYNITLNIILYINGYIMMGISRYIVCVFIYFYTPSILIVVESSYIIIYQFQRRKTNHLLYLKIKVYIIHDLNISGI